MTRLSNVAVFGCGMIVRRGHLPGLRASERAAVPVIYGPDTPNSYDLARTFGIPRLVHSIEEALATPGLDAVVVALPNHQHGPVALAAIEAGLPILLEKPIASEIDIARRIVSAARAAEVRISMSLPQRQRPSLIDLKHLIEAGKLGRIESIDVKMTRRAGIPGFGGWFTRRELSGGGVLMDLGPHVVDTVFWLAGCSNVTTLSGRLWSTHGPIGQGLGDWGSRRNAAPSDGSAFNVEDRARWEMDLACGTNVQCEVAWAHYGDDENRIRVVGEKGGADYWPERYGHAAPLRIFHDGHDGRPADNFDELAADHDPLDFAWTKVTQTFVEDLGRDESRLVSGAEALVAAELIERIYEGSRQIQRM